MDIVIVGDGKVGFALSEQLNREGHNITVIDSNQRTLAETQEKLDIMGVVGNGATRDVQIEAGVGDADLLIAATSGDELNMICCLTAKHLGCQKTIARIRNPDYLQQMDMFKEQFGLSLVINPDLEAAREISRIIKFPPALKVDTFSRGRVELVEFRLRAGSSIAGKRLMDIPFTPKSKVLICAVERCGEVFIPDGSFQLLENDKIYITGDNRAIVNFIHSVSTGDFSRRIRSVIIVGGGRLSYYLTRMLDHRRFDIKIIEIDGARCEKLCELLPGASIIHADGTDMGAMEAEGLENADALIALTGMDEENMILSMVAKKRGVSKVVAKVNRFNYLDIVDQMEIDSVVSPKMSTANQIAQYVRAMQNTRGSAVKTLYKLVDGQAEAVEFSVREGTRHLGETLEQIRLRKNLLVGVIVRDGRVIIPGGRDYLQAGDSVVVITNQKNLFDLNDIFEG